MTTRKVRSVSSVASVVQCSFVALSLTLAGCTTAPPKSDPPRADAPKKPSYYSDDGPPESVPSNLASIPDAVPKDEPFHRFANRPYTVFGRSYAPVVNKEPMKERGIASWYGKKFHGQKTSSGDRSRLALTSPAPSSRIARFARSRTRTM